MNEDHLPENSAAAWQLPSETREFCALLIRAAVILAVCAVLVAVAYFFIDKPVAYFVFDHDLKEYIFLKWMTYPPIYLEALAPVVIVLAAAQRAWRPLNRWERAIFAAAINLLIAIVFKDHLKFVFGRYWPTTWIHDNPSLIPDGAYGFHPFHQGVIYGSFPSGHTARICAVVSVFWFAYPRWRGLCVLAAGSVIVGLVGMNYHFVGDTVAGVGLGFITGTYTVQFFQLNSAPPPLPNARRAGEAGP